MNNLRTHNKAILSRLLLGMALFGHSLYGITVNNTPLEQIAEPGHTVVITPKKKDSFIVFQITEDNIDIDSADINYFKNLKEVFEDRNSNKSGGIRSKVCNLSSNTINYNCSYFVGQERMNIEARTSLNFVDCLLESPNIVIKGNQMNFSDCFLINAQILYIIANSPEARCQVIRITFDEESTSPTLITGEINLENNQTSRRFMITNVKKVEFQFALEAWEE